MSFKCGRTHLTKYEDEISAKIGGKEPDTEYWQCSHCKKWHHTDPNSPAWKKDQYGINPATQRRRRQRQRAARRTPSRSLGGEPNPSTG